MKKQPPAVRRSVRAYRWLIQAYPDSFRQAFGDGMVEVFTDMACDAWHTGGPRGLLSMWFRVVADLAWSVLAEHRKAPIGEAGMKTAFYLLASVALAMVVQMFVMGTIGIAIVTLSLMKAEIVAGSPVQRVLELLLFFLPPFFAAMILMRTRPNYRPRLTAPLGAMALFTLAFLADSKAPWWAGVIVVALGGALSLAGCLLGSLFAQPCGKETVPLSETAR